MSEDQLQVRGAARGSSQAGSAPGAGGLRRAPLGSQNVSGPRVVKPPRRIWFALVVIVLTVGLAAVWTVVARRQLATSIAAENADRLGRAPKAYARLRAAVQADLQAHCRVLAEDPRLKATLATEGMDAATVADILNDLSKLRGKGFLMVLSPEGRVFAEAGAEGLRGLDLSESAVVKKAQAASDAAVGSWILDNRVIDLAIQAIRYDTLVVAHVVVAQAVDASLLQAVAESTGVEIATAMAGAITLASSTTPAAQAAFAQVAREAGAFSGRVMTIGGTTHVTGVAEVAEGTQTQRLLLARPIDGSRPSFELLEWMIFVPPLLVLIAVLFAMTGPRAFRRT